MIQDSKGELRPYIYMSVKSNYTRNIQIMLTEVFYMQVTIHTVVTNRRICQIR